MQKLFLILTVLLNVTVLAAQGDSAKASIKLIGRYKNNAVELRWYPTSSTTWRITNKNGYLVERMELGKEGATFKQIAIVKPYTTAEWNSRTDMQNDFVRATKEAIYSIPSMPKENEGFEKVLQYQNDENGIFFTFMLSTNLNIQAAEAAGMKFTDKTIVAGTEYAYKVSINNTKNDEDAALVFIGNTITEKQGISPKGLRIEEGEGAVKLFWDYSFNRTQFSAYYIERSADGGKTFKPLNNTPLIFTVKNAEEVSYTDSVKNYIPYQYRIKGITAFGENSEPCAAMAGMGKDKTPAVPASNVRADGDRNKITVTWSLPNPSKDVKGFFVARGTSLNGPFKTLHTDIRGKDERFFVDTKPSPQEPYYIVYTLDTARNISNTFSVMASVYDSVAPKQPLALNGKIDSAGVVTINWKYGSDNDLHGYHVYRANGKNNVYHQLTGYPLNDSTFTDTISMRSLTEEVYYKITAVDYNNNPSPYSEIAELKRPDIIAPSAPLILSYNVVANKVTLNWELSSSSDVVKHELRRKAADGKMTVLTSFTTNSLNTFIDSTVTEGADYSYELTAIDDAGLQTPSTPLNITIAETTAKAGVEKLDAKLDEKDKEVTLRWEYGPKGNFSFIVLKTTPDGITKPVRTIDSNTNTFIDSNIASGKYQYAIKILYSNGSESGISKPVSIEVR